MKPSGEMISLKCVTVGDGFVGKTCLLTTYAEKTFPTHYVPTVFENKTVHAEWAGKSISLDLWDTAGQEEYSKLRPLSYSRTDVFIVCFSIVRPESFDNVSKTWYPELTKVRPKSSIVLVGTKADLRADKKTLDELKKMNLQPISFEQGRALAKRIRAAKYVECSALKQTGVVEVFEEAMRAAISPVGQMNQKRCTVL